MVRIGKSPRFEDKYVATTGQIELIKCHLERICDKDDFSDANGVYGIRSLYFDDYENSSYRDNEIGIEPRSKFRLRIYNCESDIIFLEQKIKAAGKIYKERTRVSREFCELLLRNDWNKLDYPVSNRVVNRFLTAYYTRILQPRIIVDYNRETYTFSEGDVRVTFDRNISFSDNTADFFDSDILLHPIMKTGTELLEVKYTDFLPDTIYQGINIKQLQQYTFSKYFLCESYRRMGGGI